MIDPIGIKVFCHFLKTFHPPAVAVFFHDIPVICRKSPVLPVDGEIIGWSTCLSVEIEVMSSVQASTLLRLIPIGISLLIRHRVDGHIRLQTVIAGAGDTEYSNTMRYEDSLQFPAGTFFYIFRIINRVSWAIYGNWGVL